MKRITTAQLETLIKYLNESTGSPVETYSLEKTNGLTSNPLNFHLYFAYGAVGVHRICKDGNGSETIINLGTKREIFNGIHHLLLGLQLGSK